MIRKDRVVKNCGNRWDDNYAGEDKKRSDSEKVAAIDGTIKMENENKENMEEILSSFFDTEKAKEADADIRAGDELLRSCSAPEPDEMLISNIKADISTALSQKQTVSWQGVFGKAIAVAAVFIILAGLSVRLFEKESPESPESPEPVYIAAAQGSFWEDDDSPAAEAEFAVLVAEAELIESELLALQLGEDRFNGHENSLEIERELVEIVSDFWKG